MLFRVVLLLLLLGSLPGYVDARDGANKQPWFLMGTAASEARRSPKSRGFMIELEWLPQVFLDAGILRSFVSVELQEQQLTMLGQIDLTWQYMWIANGRPPFPNSQSRSLYLGDGGTLVRLKYRWLNGGRESPYHREVQLIWYPGTHQPMQIGVTQESLWSVYLTRLRNSLSVVGSFGGVFSWDIFRLEGLVVIGKNQWAEKGQVVAHHQPGAIVKLDIRPAERVWLGVHAGYFLRGMIDPTGPELKPYLGGGVHVMVQVHWGDLPSELVFIHRRHGDLRAQRLVLPPRRSGTGIALFSEFGVRGHSLRHPTQQAETALELSYTATAKVLGQWKKLRAALQFHWRSFDWLTFEKPGLVPFQARGPNNSAQGLFQLTVASAVQVHQAVSIGGRLDIALPARVTFGSPPGSGGSPNQMLWRWTDLTHFFSSSYQVAWDYTAALHVRWELWSFVTLVVEAWMYADTNVPISGGGASTAGETSLQFGSELLLQMRFR